MGIVATVEERMISKAQFGLFFADLKIGKNKAIQLRQEGLSVTDLKSVNYFPRLHHMLYSTVISNCSCFSYYYTHSMIYK